MFRRFTALLLLLAFLASTFSKAVIVVDFYANQEYIARNLCENRDKPMLHCCGRCLLRRRLAQQDNQDKNSPERKVDNKQEVLYHEDLAILAKAPIRCCIVHDYFMGTDANPIDRSLDIFHPPA
jgi:hypothetical protein